MDSTKYLVALIGKIKEEIPEPNRTYILDFLSSGKLKGLSDARRLEQARHLHRMSLNNPKDFKEWKERDVASAIDMYLESKSYYKARGKRMVLFDKPYSESTILGAKIVLKSFFKWLYGGDGYPDCVKAVQCRSVKGVKVTERDVLSLADIKAMANACTTTRDKAFIWCLYESGGRRGEIHRLRRRDVEFDENGAILILHTEKTENRSERGTPIRKVRISYGAYDLATWMDSLTDKSPDAFVWIGHGTKNTGNQLSIDSLSKIVQSAAENAGVKKKTWLHLFRHSRATELASRMSDQAMRIYFGWSRTSEMPSHYSHLTNNQVDEAVLEAIYGIEKVKKEGPNIQVCPRCHFRNIVSKSSDYCHGCGFPLKSDLARAALERRNTVDRLMNVATEYPELIAVLEKILQKEFGEKPKSL